MSEMLQSILIGTGALSFALVLAVLLTYFRSFKPLAAEQKIQLIKWIILGLATHALHVSEEFVMEFHILFPEMLGLSAWSSEFFVVFNLIWMAIWAISIIGVWKNQRITFVPIWFLTIGYLGNAVAHPLFSLSQGMYFPGLWTSPLAGWIGWKLLKQLSTLKS